MDPKKPKRKYQSARRQAQASQTRTQILSAARLQFLARGYPDTTVEAIAAEAGVSAETIYSVFGSKLNLLKMLVDVSVTGDDQPVPLLQREHIQAAREAVDQHTLIHDFAANIYPILERMAPIFALLRANRTTDAEIAAILDRHLKQRLMGITFFVEQMRRIGPLRPNLSLEEAAESVWAVSSGEVFLLLTQDRGWSKNQYIEWLVDLLNRLLLE